MPFKIEEGLIVEPQLQYIYRGMSLDDEFDGVADARFGHGHSHQVRAGIRFSNNSAMVNESVDVPASKDVPITWWLRPSVTQTFGTDTTLRISAPGVEGSRVDFHPSQNGTAVAVEVGLDGKIRKNVTLGYRAGTILPIQGGAAWGYNGQINLKLDF